jgi:pyruvate carboxylase
LAGENRVQFIEVNPRLPEEHTVTEEVTGSDLIQAQMKLATGVKLDEFKSKCYHAIFFASTGIDLLFFYNRHSPLETKIYSRS